jgi:O-antigen ligase
MSELTGGAAASIAVPRLGIARVIDILALVAVALTPLLYSYRFVDPFRQPKVLLLHGAGIALIGLMAAAALVGAIDWRQLIRRRLPDLIAVSAVAWTIVTGLFAAHRRTAIFALITVAGAAALFVALRWGARRYRTWALLPIVITGAVNAGLAIVQEAKIWNELVPLAVRPTHAGTAALLGNPNDVGSFLVPCLIATLAWMLATRRMPARLLLAAAALLIGTGIVASRTRGAFLGAAAGIAVLAIVRWGRRAAIWMAALAVIAALAAASYKPLLDRAFSTEIEVLLSGRIVPFAAAWQMFKDSPVLGIGPGCFAWGYMDYAAKVYPTLLEYAIAGKQFNFGEVHNDHLQILAETGLIGYLLFLAALVSLAAMSFRSLDAPERTRFARLCGAPLAAGLFALALFQFPLYLAAPLTAFVAVASLAIGWSEDDATA